MNGMSDEPRCQRCWRPLEYTGRGRPPKYCSHGCRDADYRHRKAGSVQEHVRLGGRKAGFDPNLPLLLKAELINPETGRIEGTIIDLGEYVRETVRAEVKSLDDQGRSLDVGRTAGGGWSRQPFTTFVDMPKEAVAAARKLQRVHPYVCEFCGYWHDPRLTHDDPLRRRLSSSGYLRESTQAVA